MLRNKPMTKALFTRFLRGLNHEGLTCDTCWEWQKGAHSDGYGTLGPKGNQENTHRLACRWMHGPPPAGKPCALHSCHNPRCCNPNHLRWGSQGENMRDKVAAGRARGPQGSAHPSAKLTERDVVSIRSRAAKGESQTDLAKEFGVTSGTMSSLINRRTWKHL